MKKQFGLLLGVFLLSSTSLMFGQKATNIKINEVLTKNTTGVQDEFGQREAWVEIANASFSTFNVRGMYITTDRSVLNPNMTVSERITKMSMIPNEEVRTNLTARQHLLFYCNSNPAKGSLHLSVKINPQKPLWIALYDGNATDIVDSVTVPPLTCNESYARIHDGAAKWEKKDSASVTPGISNYIRTSESKVAKVKRQDPYGIGISVLAMGIVFFCLLLMYAFFRIFGIVMEHKAAAKKVVSAKPIKAVVETGHKTGVILQDGLKFKGIDKEIYIAVIAMALKQYQDDVHDVESGIITIRPKHTSWNDEAMELINFID
jgi:hypothetical protein